MRIYIAGPYTAPTPEGVEANVRAAIDAGIEIYRRGHIPYIPHLTHYMELRNLEVGAGLSYEDYMRMDRFWIYACSGFLYLASSPGADRELELVQRHRGDHIIYRSLEEIPVVTFRKEPRP